MRRSLRVNPPKRKAPAKPPTRFTPETLEQLREDIVTRRIPLERTSISDDRVTGLRALIRKSGHVSFHIHYSVGDARPYMVVGHYPDADEVKKNPKSAQEAIDDARKISTSILELARKGIDVQEGLHTRLLREIREQGSDWRPE